MAKTFFSQGIKAKGVLSALFAALLLLQGCTDTAATDSDSVTDSNVVTNPPDGGVDPTDPTTDPTLPPVVPPTADMAWKTVQLMARIDPLNPENEQYLDDWRFQIYTIDDQARPTSPLYYGEVGPDGNGAVGLPAYMFSLPLVVNAYNDALPLADVDNDDVDECRSFQIFIPPNCYDKSVWLLGPLEDALWRYYKVAAEKRAESWNPSQVDCATWLANLQQIILTDQVNGELEGISETDDMLFDATQLTEALQENQQLLTPTRPPICMAEYRHNGGSLERAAALGAGPWTLDDDQSPFGPVDVAPDDDDIIIGTNGLVDSICGLDFSASMTINTQTFNPTGKFELDDSDFMGTVHDQSDIVDNMDVSVFNVRLGNGRPLDHDKYDDACALSTLVQFTNTDNDEQDVLHESGVTFDDLFDNAVNDVAVYLTSDGDAVVGDNDHWAILYDAQSTAMQENALVVELLGHRQKDFRDVLHMTLGSTSDDLFIGLRADYQLNEETVDGELAYMGFTLSYWDGSTADGRSAIRTNIANCYEAADVWARQFFITQWFQTRSDECCAEDTCEIDSLIKPLVAAEWAARSQCFSNSRSNGRWQTEDVGFWSMNTNHGVGGNVIVNAGWLAPDMDFQIYIQKFDEAVFKGPRTIRRSDSCGQLMAEIPTLVEGDRVLIKAEDNCCDDYDLVLPCVPEFTGFAGEPGVPYVPATVAPDAPPAADPAAPPAI